RATDWSVASASTRAPGGWPTSGGRKGSSSHWPSASAEPRNARTAIRALDCRRSPGGRGRASPDGDNQALTPPATPNASPSKHPRHHKRELFAPERAAVRPGPLRHHNVRTRIAQRDRPRGRVLEEERLQRARNEVRARNRARHHPRRTVTRARRGAEDRTVEVRVPEPDRERQLPTRR